MALEEKPLAEGSAIKDGFPILSPTDLDHIEGDNAVWEGEPLEKLAAESQLAAWRHDGFLQPMDTLREKELLEDLWRSGVAPWRTWS